MESLFDPFPEPDPPPKKKRTPKPPPPEVAEHHAHAGETERAAAEVAGSLGESRRPPALQHVRRVGNRGSTPDEYAATLQEGWGRWHVSVRVTFHQLREMGYIIQKRDAAGKMVKRPTPTGCMAWVYVATAKEGDASERPPRRRGNSISRLARAGKRLADEVLAGGPETRELAERFIETYAEAGEE